jgi:hypothetical protein
LSEHTGKNKRMSEKEIKTLFLRSIYEAAIEILGTSDSVLIFSTIINWDGAGEIPEIKNKPQFLSDLGNEFAIRFQRNTAKGLLLRIGDSSFPFLRRNIKKLAELGSIENRLKSISKRFEHSLGVLAENLSALTGLGIKAIKMSQNHFCLEIARSVNDDLFSSDLHLFYFSGLLRAFCVWMDSRKEYFINVNEENEVNNDGKLVCFKFEDISP